MKYENAIGTNPQRRLFTGIDWNLIMKNSTGSDNYWKPAVYADKELPRYQDQTIWPYTDMIQHRLYMKNGIHGSWCRTTPLWGRGLSRINTGAEDRLHDNRARNVIEAIMWHGYSKDSEGYRATEKFYNLSKEERDAVVEFKDHFIGKRLKAVNLDRF